MLKTELKEQFEPFIRQADSVSLISSTDYNVESHISKLNQENLQLERELKLQREIAEKYSNEITQLSRTKEAIRQEKNLMRVEITEYKSQVHLQWEHFLHKMSEDLKECKENLIFKEKLLKVSTAEIENLNSIIQQQGKMKQKQVAEMKEMKAKLNSIKECNMKLEQLLQEEDASNKELKKENNRLKEEMLKLRERLKSCSATDKAISDLVDKKVEEWKQFIESLNRETDYYKTQIQILKQKLENDKEIFKPSSIVTLSKVIAEKDQVIDKLKKQNEEISFKLAEKKRFSGITPQMLFKESYGEKAVEPANETWQSLRQQVLDAEKSRQEAERHAFEKDKELCKAQRLIRKYEKEYGIEEAKKEIENLEKKLQMNDRKIENLIKILNQENMADDFDSIIDL
ncbi:centrosomal protein of 290 kDa-like isoform X2 [Octopus sinensis]|uniref:Centrosomal protein of 290 kDa-like isoform X2 n=1 Tax=Octopus sinensis TaxID=2607531 RepID=A0A7E6FPY4_9MOLL|nr:centrosomal protein of 290 kDa-like isoform X2 [Octopus sinensis]